MMEKSLLAKLFSITMLCIFMWGEEAAAQNEVFVMMDVPLYAESNNLFNAKTEAIDIGITESFKNLVRRVALTSQHWKIANIKADSIMSAVKDVTLKNERKTAFTYRGVADITFDERIVKGILSRAGFQYLTMYSPVQLVIPVLYKGGKFIIWEDEEWMSAWGNMPNTFGLLRLSYLMGDLSDEMMLDPKLATTAKLPYFKAVMQKYNATEVIIAVGSYSGNKFNISLKHLSASDDKSKLFEYKFKSEVNLEEFYEGVAKDSLETMDTYFKQYDSF